MKFSIILSCPVFSPHLQECLDSILRSTTLSPGNTELIVVHDGSRTARELENTWLQREEQKVQFLSAAPTRSSGVARNIGAAEAGGDFLVFLDSDVLVTPGWLDALSAPVEEKKVGVVGAKLLDMESGLVSHAGLVFNSALRGFYPIYHHFDPKFHGVNKQRKFPAVLGFCMLIRSELFDSAAGFVSDGCEDVDFCLKAGEAGSVVVYTPDCVLQHRGTLSRSHICTAQDSFRRRWNLDAMQSDDERYYYEDGMRVRIDDQARISYKEVVSESCDYTAQALRLGVAGKTEEAEKLLLKALVVYPGNADAYLELAELSMREGLPEKALSYCDQLLSLQPRFPRALLTKARILLEEDQQSIPAEILKELWESPDADDSVKKEARELLRAMAARAN